MSTASALEHRVAQLERSHRRLRALAMTLAGLLLAVVSLGTTAAPPPGTVVAKSIQVVDNEGKVRILINPRAGVSLLDEQGRPRAVLSVDRSGPGLAMYGTTSKAGTILNVNADGPALAMRDNNGMTRALLTTMGPGPALIMSDEKETERIALVQQGKQASLSVIDQSRRVVWRAP